jgi:uncharacterized membrane protein HdeD (DUF308 family)
MKLSCASEEDSMQPSFAEDIRGHARRMSWWLGLRGVLAVLFGVLIMVRPPAGVLALIVFFAVYAFADGISAAVAAFRNDTPARGRALLFIEAIVGIAAGILAFARPGTAGIVVLVILAIRALVLGALQVAAAVRIGPDLPNRWLITLGGVASVGFGILLLARPGPGLLALGWLVGVYAFTVGLLQIASAFAIGGAVRRPTVPRPVP